MGSDYRNGMGFHIMRIIPESNNSLESDRYSRDTMLTFRVVEGGDCIVRKLFNVKSVNIMLSPSI